MLHSGYIRYFGQAIRLLADDGHRVHLAFTRLEKDPGDARLAHDLAACHPNITVGEAPLRPRTDGWRPLAGLARGLIDLARYIDPRYADAPALRARMARKLTEHVSTARAVDPLTARATLRAIRYLQAQSGEPAHRRIVGALAAVERAIPTSPAIDAYLLDHRPDAVLVTPAIEFASTQVEYVKSARAAGIPTGVAVASWDNLTGKGLIRVLPDRVYVWNEIQVREAEELHGVPRGATIATGAAKFDEWFERRPQWTRGTAGRAGRARPRAPIRPLRLLLVVHRAGRGRVRPRVARAAPRGRAARAAGRRRARPAPPAERRPVALRRPLRPRQRLGLAARWCSARRRRRQSRFLRVARAQLGRRRDQHQRAPGGGDTRQERARPARAAVRRHAARDAALPLPAARERRLPACRLDPGRPRGPARRCARARRRPGGADAPVRRVVPASTRARPAGGADPGGRDRAAVRSSGRHLRRGRRARRPCGWR